MDNKDSINLDTEKQDSHQVDLSSSSYSSSPLIPLSTLSSSNSHQEESNLYPSLPSHDPHLSNLRLFWYLFWVLLSELLYFICLIINYTAFTSISQHHGKEAHISPYITVLYLLPSLLVIVSCLAVLSSTKRNYLVREILFFVLVLSAFAGFIGEGHALYQYIKSYSSDEACEEFESWTAAVVQTFYAVLMLCPIPFRIGMALALNEDKQYKIQLSRSYSSFAVEPVVTKWRGFIVIFDTAITVCCMPMFCRDKDARNASEHTRHIQQHVIQLIYEIILFVIALVEHKYIELIAIVAGLLGSLMGLTRVFMLDSVLNLFALLTGLFLVGNLSSKIECEEQDFTNWIYLFMFSLIASSIRFKSFIHTFIETRMQIYHWTMAQLDWISEMEYNSRRLDERVFQIPNFFTLRKYGDTHVRKEEKKQEEEEREKQETSPLISKPKQQKITKAAILTAVTFMVGLCILIGISIAMGEVFPAYKGGEYVNEIMRWRSSNCTLVAHDTLSEDYLTYYHYYSAATPQKEVLLAIPIELRYSFPLNPDFDKDYYKTNMYSTVPCRIPPINQPANATGELDYNRESEIWKKVTILGSDEDIKKYQTNYFLWTIIPSFGLFMGVSIIIVSIVMFTKLRKMEQLATTATTNP